MRDRTNENILVLEDEFIISESLKMQLQNFGFGNVYCAFNGDEALDIARNHELNYAVLDISVPGSKNGIETASELLKIQQVPVLFLSAYTEEKVVKEALQTKPYNYLVKPWKERELYVALEVARVKFDAEATLQQRLLQLEKDLNKRKQIEINQLTIRNRELEEMSDFRHSLLSVLSHDISAPLRSVSGMAHVLIEDKNTSAENRTNLDALAKTAEKAQQLLEQLLKWSASRMDIITYKPGQVNVEELLEKAPVIFKGELRQKQLKVHKEVAQKPLYIQADGQMILSVLYNLLQNAITWSPAGGSIWLKAGIQGNKVRFTVQDKGQGIDPEKQKKLLKIETSESYITESLRNSEGLGLKMAAAYIKRHDEAIWFESTPGKGSTFYFTMPPVSEAGS